MRRRTPTRRTLVITGIAGCLLLSNLVFYIVHKSSTPDIDTTRRSTQIVVPVSQPDTAPTAISLPSRLKIPSIGVDAAVQSMGLTADGAMAATKTPNDVGWYKLGQRPGQVGNAVIAGHYGWIKHLPAAFDNLHTMHPGDEIFIEDDKGGSTTFIVDQLKLYGQNDNTKDVFGSNDGKAHLNLITCEGAWNKTTKSYSSRLVVFADKE